MVNFWDSQDAGSYFAAAARASFSKKLTMKLFLRIFSVNPIFHNVRPRMHAARKFAHEKIEVCKHQQSKAMFRFRHSALQRRIIGPWQRPCIQVYFCIASRLDWLPFLSTLSHLKTLCNDIANVHW